VAGLYPAYRASRIYPKALQVDELRQQMELVAAEKRAIDQTYHQLVLGRERERERLARELHDQSLIGFKFRLAEKVQETQPELQDELNKVIASLRGICADLRPPALEALGLTAVLRSYAEEFSVRTGLIVEFMVEGEERRLSPEAEISLFRVVQEALTNAWKHAQAPKAVVSLNFKTEGVELVISDKGRGFALPERLGMMTERGHFGLVNMQERLALVGGKLQVTSMPEHGTTVTATVSFT
jgi:signal transduction histidine kinase